MTDDDINALFSGYGMALRRENDPPIPGEPLMSIATAKEIVRPYFARLKMLDPEVIARVQNESDIADARHGNVLLRLSDVQAMLAALSVPIATQSPS